MAEGTTNATLIGAVVAGVTVLAPVVWNTLTGRKRGEADSAEVVAQGAGSVTAAALALLTASNEEHERTRVREARCQAQLDELGVRCSALEAEVQALRSPGG